MFARCLSLLLCMSVSVEASAAQATNPDATTLSSVAVTGAANAEQIRYSDLLAGVEAFKKYRHYAPDATLTFYLRDNKPESVATLAQLVLRTDDKDIPVPVAIDGKFDLPTTAQVGGKDGFLVANRAAGTVSVEAMVRSASDSETALRLGDMRLQCEVSWAIEKQDVPKSIRAFFFLGGRMCHTSKIAANYFRAKHKLASVSLSDKGKSVPVKIGLDRVTYWAPLGETQWSDDAVVTQTYADTAQVRAQQ